MATRNGPNLDQITRTFTRFLDDTCRIVRDFGNPNDSLDDVFDEETGSLTPPSPEGTTVYSGKCKFSPILSSEPRYAQEGEGFEGRRYYNLSLLKATSNVKIGDTVTITSSRRDPASVGKVFHIREVVYTSWAIQRKCVMELRQPI